MFWFSPLTSEKYSVMKVVNDNSSEIFSLDVVENKLILSEVYYPKSKSLTSSSQYQYNNKAEKKFTNIGKFEDSNQVQYISIEVNVIGKVIVIFNNEKPVKLDLNNYNKKSFP